jgi:hypothetical protein
MRMLNSHTFTLQIDRSLADVYEFLLEPRNFAKWAFVGDVRMKHLSGRDWSVETSVGPRILRFAERNGFGVLDHFSFLTPDSPPHPIAMRVIDNHGGTELVYTSFQRAEMPDAQWQSQIEWVNTDLLALKSLLESHQE